MKPNRREMSRCDLESAQAAGYTNRLAAYETVLSQTHSIGWVSSFENSGTLGV